MKTRRLIYGLMVNALMGVFPAGLHAQDAAPHHVVWFDQPTSLRGRACWYGGKPELWTDGRKPVAAGAMNANADAEWERRSLPLGNGSIGTNVMGSISVERLTLNEKTLWRGGPNTARGAAYYWDVNKHSAHMLDSIRQAFLEGDDARAARLTQDHFNGMASYDVRGEEPFRFGSFTTMGELCVETGLSEEGVTGYRRELSLDSALATVSFRAVDGVRYERRTFVSYPDNVMAMRFTASQGGRQNLRFVYAPNPVSEGVMTATDKGSDLCYTGRLDNNGMQYVVRLHVTAIGGTVDNADGVISVSGADEVVCLLTADTDYKLTADPDFSNPLAYVGVDPAATTRRWMNCAARRSWNALLKRHYADYAALFGRVGFRLNDAPANPKPTPQRLADYRAGRPDYDLETLYYHFGRYLLIASSRPGNLPANLQGIWHNNVDGPWRVDYHNNINLQMNYWPALSANLAECAEPLTDFIASLEKPGRETARAYFGARGWAANISANIFGFTAPLSDKDMSWNFNPMAASWLATHLWDYYAYTLDRRFLSRTAYPLIRGCALFTEDYLWRTPDGRRTAAPSTSPEHGPVDSGTTFTHAVAREILTDAIEAARLLGVDADDCRRWQGVLDSIPPYSVGRYGQLMEWSRDIDDPDDHHRHVNHLYGLHPGRTILPLSMPGLAAASRTVLEHRGDGATGWSMGWKLNQWARLHDGNHSYMLYGNLLRNGTADNLWDMHPPFQIDGNLGGTAGVTEMLLQSHAGFIHLLPALPDAWAKGEITGLRAQGNFGVDIRWADGRLTEAVIRSGSGGVCTVRYGNAEQTLHTKRGQTYTIRF